MNGRSSGGYSSFWMFCVKKFAPVGCGGQTARAVMVRGAPTVCSRVPPMGLPAPVTSLAEERAADSTQALGKARYSVRQGQAYLAPLSIAPESPVFALDSRLQQDTHVLGDFALCRLLLSNDSNYPWFILVPRRSNITEVFQLSDDDRLQLWQETNALASTLNTLFSADKINIGALGNVVSQLHMHVIVRYKADVAWPAPVWGRVAAVSYSEEQLAGIRARLKGALGDDFQFTGV